LFDGLQVDEIREEKEGGQQKDEEDSQRPMIQRKSFFI